jgi:hypothetical protein
MMSGSRETIYAAINDANNVMLSQFGLLKRHLRITSIAHSVVYIPPAGSPVEKEEPGSMSPPGRKEKYLFSSADSVREMSISLDIRNDQILKVEIETSSATNAAGRAWAEKIKEWVPSVRVFINGTLY